MTAPDTKYGWFSPKQALRAGTGLYERPDGTEVRVSMVTNDHEHGSGYDDIICVGEVTRYIGHPDPVKQLRNEEMRLLLERFR